MKLNDNCSYFQYNQKGHLFTSIHTSLSLVRWAWEEVDVYTNRMRQLVGLAGFEGVRLERVTELTFLIGFPDGISTGDKHREPDNGRPNGESKSTDHN